MQSVTTSIDGVVTSTTTYTYDNNGNQLTVIKDGELIVTNTYDLWNQLIQTVSGDSTIVNTYNGEGLRVAKEVDGVKTDFQDVVKHISIDRRLGMSKLDVYSMRRSSKEAIKRIPKDLSNTAGEFKDYVISPEFKQGVKNTGVIVMDQTPLGGFRKV